MNSLLRRSIARVRLVLHKRADDADAHGAADVLAQSVADALTVSGTAIRQQTVRHNSVIGGSDGAPRADAALWLPDTDGVLPQPDTKVVLARVHVGVCVAVPTTSKARAPLLKYDALFCVHDQLTTQLRSALASDAGRAPPVSTVRLPLSAPLSRVASKALRGVRDRPVVMVDLRQGFDGNAERAVIQLGLVGSDLAPVLCVPHDVSARQRVRLLCERHAVDAWLVSGAAAVAEAASACDIYVGAPVWQELMVLAANAVDVVLPSDFDAVTGGDVLGVLSERGRVDARHSVLQLAATLDRKLSDLGAALARGTALQVEVCAPDHELLDALGRVEPVPDAARTDQWEPVGPHAQGSVGVPMRVDARDPVSPGTAAKPSAAERIETQLQRMKDELARGQT